MNFEVFQRAKYVNERQKQLFILDEAFNKGKNFYVLAGGMQLTDAVLLQDEQKDKLHEMLDKERENLDKEFEEL